MGNAQVNGRKIKHVLPYFNGYNQLSNAESLTHPLLLNPCESMEKPLQLEKFIRKSVELEKEVKDLKSSISRIESKLESCLSKPTSKEIARVDNQIGKELKDLKHKVSKLELKAPLDPLIMKKQELEIEKIRRSNAGMEKKIAALETTVSELQSICSNLREIPSPTDNILKVAEEDHPIDNLIGCIVVLMFLICIQIGINL